MTKLYIVNYIADYDTYEVSYHKTKKGAYKYIMQRQYDNWQLLGYVQQGSYDELMFTITEKELKE